MKESEKSNRYKNNIIDLIKFALVMGFMAWLIGRGTHRLGYNWHWNRVWGYIFFIENGKFYPGPLLKGLIVTLKVSAWSFVLAVLFGLVTAFLRLSGSFVSRVVARSYVELIRNTPLLVQIFFLYFVLAPVFDLERFQAAVFALSLFEGAYISEIFRAGITSIHKGQWEAAYSLGLDRFITYRFVILPQAVRRILPLLTSQAVSLIKDSALISTIAVYDITMEGRTIIAETFMTFEIWFTVAAFYLAITITISFIVKIMEDRFKIKSY